MYVVKPENIYTVDKYPAVLFVRMAVKTKRNCGQYFAIKAITRT